MRTGVVIGVLLAVLGVAFEPGAQTVRVLEDWSETPARGQLPPGWSFMGKEPSPLPFPPAVVLDEGRRALWLKTEHYSLRLFRARDAALAETPVLTWEWKALTLPAEGDIRGEIADQVARIVLIFPPRYRPRMLGYVWDTRAPVGTEAHRRRTMFERWLIVVRSGAEGVGKWVRERRDVERDYTRLFGGAPPALLALGVESHSEDAAHASEVYIGAITLGR